jgi:hypothetical protein
MPQLPSGSDIMTPPILALPSAMMSLKDLRSSDSTSADRILGSLNGATSRLTIRLIELLVGCSSQIAFGSCALMSRTSATVRSSESVMSNSPATKAKTRVERLEMTRHSMASM